MCSSDLAAELNSVIAGYSANANAQVEGLTACLTSRAIFNSERGSDRSLVVADASRALDRIPVRAGTLSTRAYLLSLLAETHTQLGDFHEAIPRFQQALRLLEDSGQGNLSVSRTVRGGLSMALSEAGQTQAALNAALANFELSVRDNLSYSRPAEIGRAHV